MPSGKYKRESWMYDTRRGRPSEKKGKPGHISPNKGKAMSVATKQKIAATLKGRDVRGVNADPYKSYTGGETGQAFANLLCSVGYIREFKFWWGDKRKNECFQLDFGHPIAKVNLNLMGQVIVHHNEPIGNVMKFFDGLAGKLSG